MKSCALRWLTSFKQPYWEILEKEFKLICWSSRNICAATAAAPGQTDCCHLFTILQFCILWLTSMVISLTFTIGSNLSRQFLSVHLPNLRVSRNILQHLRKRRIFNISITTVKQQFKHVFAKQFQSSRSLDYSECLRKGAQILCREWPLDQQKS